MKTFTYCCIFIQTQTCLCSINLWWDFILYIYIFPIYLYLLRFFFPLWKPTTSLKGSIVTIHCKKCCGKGGFLFFCPQNKAMLIFTHRCLCFLRVLWQERTIATMAGQAQNSNSLWAEPSSVTCSWGLSCAPLTSFGGKWKAEERTQLNPNFLQCFSKDCQFQAALEPCLGGDLSSGRLPPMGSVGVVG